MNRSAQIREVKVRSVLRLREKLWWIGRSGF